MWFSVLEPSVLIDTIVFPSVPERSTCIWLSFGWILVGLLRVSIFFSLVVTAFVSLPQEIAFMSLYRSTA